MPWSFALPVTPKAEVAKTKKKDLRGAAKDQLPQRDAVLAAIVGLMDQVHCERVSISAYGHHGSSGGRDQITINIWGRDLDEVNRAVTEAAEDSPEYQDEEEQPDLGQGDPQEGRTKERAGAAR